MNTLLPASSSINLSSQNVADCLKSIGNIGNTVYQNVCNGTYSTVPWGTGDWLGFGLFAFVLCGIIFLIYKAVTY